MAADLVFLTGASGFVGGYVAEELLAAGYRVRALVRDGSTVPEECEPLIGDLREGGALARHIAGARYLVHCAALYSFSPRDRAEIMRVNVACTASLLAAAHLAGIERAVVTSSSAAIGHEHAEQPAPDGQAGRPATEEDWASPGMGAYHDSKLLQERAAFASRVPLVTVLPTAPVGPRDRKPTPTGKLVLDFARGAIFARPPGAGGMNLVAVEDVARAHVSALERGQPGERYLIGGENFSFDRIWELLAEVSGRNVPRFRAPSTLAFGMAYLGFAPLEGVRMAHERMYAQSSKAIAQLDYHPAPVRDALARAVDWFRANGYV